MEFYLSDFHPKQRDAFRAMFALRGIEGVVKPKGRLGSTERMLSEEEGNLFYKCDGQRIDYDYYNAREYRDLVTDDAFINAVNEKLAAKKPPKAKAGAKKAVPETPRLSNKRGNHYYGFSRLYETDRSLTRDKQGNYVRAIFGGNAAYAVALMLTDFDSHQSVRNWMDMVTGDTDHRHYGRKPVYVHGVLIEGVNFNVTNVKPTGFNPLVYAEKPAEDSNPDAPPVLRGKVPKRKLKPEAKAGALKIENYGYIVVGQYVITNFPSHREWLESQPVDATTEDDVLTKWRNVIMRDLDKEKLSVERRLEDLNKKYMQEEQRLGQLLLLERAAKDNTNAAIKANFDKLRSIPELQSFTPTDFGFVAITGDMLATREKTGEERYCGRFEIQVSMHGAVRVRNVAAPKVGFRNPHGECVGSFGRVFGSALRTFDYYSLILAVMEYYRMVDEDHDSYFGDIPDSKEAPEKTFVSSWQTLVGTWGSTQDGRTPFELKTFSDNARDDDEGEDDDEDEDY